MKKSLPFEIAAAVLAILGAFVLIGVLMPLINPEQTKLETHGQHFPLSYYLIATPIPLAILAAAWYLNSKATALTRSAESCAGGQEAPWQKRLKWILGAVLILLVLYAFLW